MKWFPRKNLKLFLRPQGRSKHYHLGRLQFQSDLQVCLQHHHQRLFHLEIGRSQIVAEIWKRLKYFTKITPRRLQWHLRIKWTWKWSLKGDFFKTNRFDRNWVLAFWKWLVAISPRNGIFNLEWTPSNGLPPFNLRPILILQAQ